MHTSLRLRTLTVLFIIMIVPFNNNNRPIILICIQQVTQDKYNLSLIFFNHTINGPLRVHNLLFTYEDKYGQCTTTCTYLSGVLIATNTVLMFKILYAYG